MEEGYNGYRNYETWLMALNVDNDRGLYEITREAILNNEIESGTELNDFMAEIVPYSEEWQTYKICDVWSHRDWNEIDFYELFETWRDELKENEGNY